MEKKLKATLLLRGKSWGDLASALGISRATLYRKVRKDSLTLKDISGIVGFLKLTRNEMLEIFF